MNRVVVTMWTFARGLACAAVLSAGPTGAGAAILNLDLDPTTGVLHVDHVIDEGDVASLFGGAVYVTEDNDPVMGEAILQGTLVTQFGDGSADQNIVFAPPIIGPFPTDGSPRPLLFPATAHQYADDGVFTASRVAPTNTVVLVDLTTGAQVPLDLIVINGEVTVTVLNVAPLVDPLPDLVVGIGEVVSLTASFTDPGLLDTWTAAIIWGDSSASPVPPDGTIDSANQLVLSQHAYSAPGLYTVNVGVFDDDGDSGSTSFQVTVAAVPVPEPLTSGCLALGLAAIAVSRRRSRVGSVRIM